MPKGTMTAASRQVGRAFVDERCKNRHWGNVAHCCGAMVVIGSMCGGSVEGFSATSRAFQAPPFSRSCLARRSSPAGRAAAVWTPRQQKQLAPSLGLLFSVSEKQATEQALYNDTLPAASSSYPTFSDETMETVLTEFDVASTTEEETQTSDAAMMEAVAAGFGKSLQSTLRWTPRFPAPPLPKEEQMTAVGNEMAAAMMDNNAALSSTKEEKEEVHQPAPLQASGGLSSVYDILNLTSRTVNAVVLGLAFGFIVYTMFNIDHGMTRGWTQSEIAMRIPLDNWLSYEQSLDEKPMLTKTIISGIIFLLGDWLSQTAFRQQNILDFDLMRTLRNGMIGLCFGPFVHSYYEFSDSILPVGMELDGTSAGLRNRFLKIIMDQTIYAGTRISIYITLISVFNGDTTTVQEAKQNIQDRLPGIMFTSWKFWPLVHCITYGVIPARHRVLWVNSVELVWNAVVASKANESEEPKEEEDEEVVVEVVSTNGELALVANGQEEEPEVDDERNGATGRSSSLLAEERQ